MRQDRTRPASKHCSHQSPLPTERSVSDCIDTLMYSVQSPVLNPATHRSTFEAQIAELLHRHCTMLSRRELADLRIDASPPTGRFRSVDVLF